MDTGTILMLAVVAFLLYMVIGAARDGEI